MSKGSWERSWRESQKDGLGLGERLLRVLAISPSISITACVQTVSGVGGEGEGGIYQAVGI